MSEDLYERIGGEAAVNAAVDGLYNNILSDGRINHFFEGVDMARQAMMMKAFLTVAFGGPKNYSGRALRDAHARLVGNGLNDSHFEAILENIRKTLDGLNVSEDMVNEVISVADSVRDDVLGRSAA